MINKDTGMTLRQWYAGQALAGNVAALSGESYHIAICNMAIENGMGVSQVIAKSSLAFADAMLAAEKEDKP